MLAVEHHQKPFHKIGKFQKYQISSWTLCAISFVVGFLQPLCKRWTCVASIWIAGSCHLTHYVNADLRDRQYTTQQLGFDRTWCSRNECRARAFHGLPKKSGDGALKFEK
jgi:hypothetical protein